jgi:hypothetical protein
MPGSLYMCLPEVSSARPVNSIPFNSQVLTSNFRSFVNVVCFLLGNSPTSEFYMPTFRHTQFHRHREVGMKMEQSVPKHRHVKFRRRGITLKRKHTTKSTAVRLIASFRDTASVRDRECSGDPTVLNGVSVDNSRHF